MGKLQEEITKLIVAVQPNIKWKDLDRMVREIETNLPHLHDVQQQEAEV